MFSSLQNTGHHYFSSLIPENQLTQIREQLPERISKVSEIVTEQKTCEPVDFASEDLLFTYFLTKEICDRDGTVLTEKKMAAYVLDAKSCPLFCELFKGDLKKRWRILLKEGKESEELSLEEIISILKRDSKLVINCCQVGSMALQHLAAFLPQLAQVIFDVPKEDIEKHFKIESIKPGKNRDRDIQIYTKKADQDREKILKEKPWLGDPRNKDNLSKELSLPWKASKKLSSILSKIGKVKPENFDLKGVLAIPNEQGEVNNALFAIKTKDFNEIDFFFYNGGRTCFSSKSCCKIEIDPDSLNSYILSADPFTLQQFLLDILIGNISILDEKHMDEKNLLEVIRALTMCGSRLLRKGDLAKVVLSFVVCLKKKREHIDSKEETLAQQLLMGLKECIKHVPKDPEAALMMLFTTCQLLHSYAASKELNAAVARFILATGEEKLIEINGFKQNAFTWLKKVLVAENRPFAQVATALQVVAPQLLSRYLINHDGGVAFRVPLPRINERGVEQIFYLFIPMLAPQQYENLDENTAELSLHIYKELYKLFPPKISALDCLKTYAGQAGERMEVASAWMQSEHPPTCLLGIQLFLTCPDEFIPKKTIVLILQALPIGLEFSAFKTLKNDESKRLLSVVNQLAKRINSCCDGSELPKAFAILSSSIEQNGQAIALSKWIQLLSVSDDADLRSIANTLFWKNKGIIPHQGVLELAKTFIKSGTPMQAENILKRQCGDICKTHKEKFEFFIFVCVSWSKYPVTLERYNALFLLFQLADALLQKELVSDNQSNTQINIKSLQKSKPNKKKSLPVKDKKNAILTHCPTLSPQQLVQNIAWLAIALFTVGNAEAASKLLQTLLEYKSAGNWESILIEALTNAAEKKTEPRHLVKVLSELSQKGCLRDDDDKIQIFQIELIIKLKKLGDSDSTKLADQLRHQLIQQNGAILKQKQFRFLIEGWLDDNLQQHVPSIWAIRLLQNQLGDHKYRRVARQLLAKVNIPEFTIDTLEVASELDNLFAKLCESEQNDREELAKLLLDYLLLKIEQTPGWDSSQYTKFTSFCFDFLAQKSALEQTLISFLCFTQDAVKRPTAKMLTWLLTLPLVDDLAYSLIQDCLVHGSQDELKPCKQIFIQYITKSLQGSYSNRFERVEALLRLSSNEKTHTIGQAKERFLSKSQFAMSPKEQTGLWSSYLTSYLHALIALKPKPEELNQKLIPFIKHGIELFIDPLATQKCLSALFEFLGAHFEAHASQRSQSTSLAGMLAYLTAPHQVYRLLCRPDTIIDVDITEHYQLDKEHSAVSNFYTCLMQNTTKLKLTPQVISEELSDFVSVFFENKFELIDDDRTALLYEYAFAFTPELDAERKENSVEYNHYLFGQRLYDIALKYKYLDCNPLKKCQLLLYYNDVHLGTILDGSLILKLASENMFGVALEPLYTHLISSKKPMPFAILKAIDIFELLYPQILAIEKNPRRGVEKIDMLYKPLVVKCAQTPFFLFNGITLSRALFKPILAMPTGQKAYAFYDTHVTRLRYQLESTLRILALEIMQQTKKFPCDYAIHALGLIESLSGFGVSPSGSSTETLKLVKKLFKIVRASFEEQEIEEPSFIYALAILDFTLEAARGTATESENKQAQALKQKLIQKTQK